MINKLNYVLYIINTLGFLQLQLQEHTAFFFKTSSRQMHVCIQYVRAYRQFGTVWNLVFDISFKSFCKSTA